MTKEGTSYLVAPIQRPARSAEESSFDARGASGRSSLGCALPLGVGQCLPPPFLLCSRPFSGNHAHTTNGVTQLDCVIICNNFHPFSKTHTFYV